MRHRWSGWPGAWCLDCGIEDQMEACIANHSHGPPYDEMGVSVDLCQNPPCPEPGSRRFDPYYGPEPRDR